MNRVKKREVRRWQNSQRRTDAFLLPNRVKASFHDGRYRPQHKQ